MLVVGLVFTGCETESIIGDEENSFEKDFETQQKSSNMLDFYLEVYIDFTGVASQYGTSVSIVPEGMSMKAYVKNYETEMGMNFTIHESIKSTSCDYIFKWIVSNNEYYEFWGADGTPMYQTFDGTKNPLQTPKEEDDGPGFFQFGENVTSYDPYLDCFD